MKIPQKYLELGYNDPVLYDDKLLNSVINVLFAASGDPHKRAAPISDWEWDHLLDCLKERGKRKREGTAND